MNNIFSFLGHTLVAFFVFTHVINPSSPSQLIGKTTIQPTPTVTNSISITGNQQNEFIQKPTPSFHYQPTRVPTPFPTISYPTPTLAITTPSPTPTPSTLIHPEASVRGYYDSPTGDPTPLPGQKLTIKNVDNGTNYTITTGPFFQSPSLPEGRYEITAATLPGYTVSYSMCMDCTFHPNFDNGNVIDVLLPNSPHFLDVIFRYTHQ